MATDRQIEANRLNALKSTGPTSDDGKARACRNSLKHGLTGKGAVIPEEDEDALAERTAALAASFQPADAYEEMLTGWIALEDLRLRRCQVEQERYRALLARRAALSWDDDRRLEAEELYARLARKPAEVSRKLQRTAQGCDALLERWRALERIWNAKGEWTEAQQALACDLLGTPTDLREGPPGAVQVRAEIERLEQRRANVLGELDEAERALAEAGAAPPDATLRRYQRYEAASRRRLQWARAQLEQRRRDPSPELAPPVPAPRPFPKRDVAVPPGVSFVPVSATWNDFEEIVASGVDFRPLRT